MSRTAASTVDPLPIAHKQHDPGQKDSADDNECVRILLSSGANQILRGNKNGNENVHDVEVV
jgi:hypothetical protein